MKKLTYEYVKNFIENEGYKLISTEYIGAKYKLKLLCGSEHEFEMNFHHFQEGHRCPFCNFKIQSEEKTFSYEYVKSFIENQGFKLLSDEYIHGQIPLDIQCPYNHIYQVRFVNFKSGTRCPYCAGRYATKDNNLLICNPELCEEWDYSKNQKRPEEYTPNSNQKAWWKCKKCNHEWEAKIAGRNSRHIGCPRCKISHGERKIFDILVNINYIPISQKQYNKLNDFNKLNENYFISQKRFNGLYGVGNRHLSYDFYLPNQNLLIEFQGQYHDGKAKKQTKKDFQKQQEHDRRKKEYAEENNINLLEIWYWDYNNIKEILLNVLKIGSV